MLLKSFVGMCRAVKSLSPPTHTFPAEVQQGGTLLLVSDSKHWSFLQSVLRHVFCIWELSVGGFPAENGLQAQCQSAV